METLEERFPGRTIIKLTDGRRVALPRCWSGPKGQELWGKLTSAERLFILHSIVSFKYFFHYIFLPFQSELDREIWPKELPWHWAELCDDIAATIPPELCPFDQEPREDGIYRLERAWPTGSGKCVSHHTVVTSGSGMLSLGELATVYGNEPSSGESALVDLVVSGRHGKTAADAVYHNGIADTIILTTSSGRQLEGTPNHRVLVRDEGGEHWKYLSEVGEEDWVCLDRGTELWGDGSLYRSMVADFIAQDDWDYRTRRFDPPVVMTEELAELLGWFVADGCMDGNSVIITKHDPEIRSHIRHLFDAATGGDVKSYETTRDVLVCSVYLSSFFTAIGCRKGAHNKTIPITIRTARREHVVAFLRGLFGGDGSMEGSTVSYTTVSEELANHIAVTLVNMGMVPRLAERETSCDGKRFPSFRLTLTGVSVGLFLKNIGFACSYKQEALSRIVSSMPESNTNVDVVPGCKKLFRETCDAILDEVEHRGGKRHPVRRKYLRTFESIYAGHRVPSYSTIQRMIALAEEWGVGSIDAVATLREVVERHRFYDPVVSVGAGQADTYDLQVPDGRSYTANGLISHNTTLCVRAFPIYMTCINPDASGLLGTSTKGLGERHVHVHRMHFLRNPKLLACFGVQRRPDSTRTWRSDKLCVDQKKDESSGNIEVFGYGSEFEGVRFDYAISDDVVTKENCKTESSRVAVYTWMNIPFHSRLHPTRRMWVNIGTIHHANDAHYRIMQDAAEKGTWDVKIYRMVNDSDPDCPWPPKLKDPSLGYRTDNVIIDPELDKYLLWPEFWTAEKVVADYVADPFAFALTRQNRPRDPESKWFPQGLLESHCRADGGRREDGSSRPLLSCWTTDIGIPEEGSDLYEQYAGCGIEIVRRVLAIDTAATEQRAGTDPDYTVFELWGLDTKSHTRILLDIKRFRTRSPKVFKRILNTWVQAYHPDFLVFESNAMAKWSAVDIQESLGYPVIKSELKDTKLEEIEAFRDLIESYLLMYPWAQDGRTRQAMGVFEVELEGYPDEAPHDDTLMCAVHAMRKLRPGSKESIQAYVIGKVPDPVLEDIPLEFTLPRSEEPHPTYEEEWAAVARQAREAVGRSFGT